MVIIPEIKPTISEKNAKGFTVIELIVAVAVTAVLSGMLLLISTEVLETQEQSSEELERQQIAHFVLDQIQEDLQCALFRNDGNIWMAISFLKKEDNSGEWISSINDKPYQESFRIVESEWTGDSLGKDNSDNLGQGPFEESRFGIAGAWLRFFTQSPELDRDAKNNGAARAISYQIVRYGLSSSPDSSKRYHLFRSDVSAKNTFLAGYNLDPELDEAGKGYGKNASTRSLDDKDPNTPRIPSLIVNPIIPENSQYNPTAFSLSSNIIDFGIRAYHLEKNSFGSGDYFQIFPSIDVMTPGTIFQEPYFATSHPNYHKISVNGAASPTFYLFPDVVDVMIRVISQDGARILEDFEEGRLPETEAMSWWSIAEEHSKVYFRRIKIYGSGI
jgi:prepilin-type N-terminal cleavage/methylation domain-containing protein